jgi:3',5'-cyclic AMP phosphodiesterase CpdA
MTKIRIALCSDTHYWPTTTQRFGNLGSQQQPASKEILHELITEIRAINPDLVFHLGDFTCGGGSFSMPADDFLPNFRQIIEALQQLPGDFYGLPGNHDAPLGELYGTAEQYLDLPSKQGVTIDTPYARLILLNAQGHDQHHVEAALPFDPTIGFVAPAELKRLERDLASAGDRPVLLFVHQLLQPWQSDQPWADLYGIENAAEVLDLLAKAGNVAAVFQAHAHRLDIHQEQLGGRTTHFVILPAIIEYPMAWLELQLTADELWIQMHRLALPELAESSRQSGDIDWRAGRAEWQNFRFPLAG